MIVKANDSRLHWEGVVSLEHIGESIKPWRIDWPNKELFANELLVQAAKPSGVRICFRTDAQAIKIGLSYEIGTTFVLGRSGQNENIRKCPIEARVNGEFFTCIDVEEDAEYGIIENLPSGMKDIELWLPANATVTVHELELVGASVCEAPEDSRPRWITHGSSITHCVRAETPAQIWPAIAARDFGFNVTSLGYGGHCVIEYSVAAMIRDMPADMISLKLGINTYSINLSPRTFGPAVIGMIRTIREVHTDTPMILCSPIYSPPRETTPGPTGLTLEFMRQTIAEIVEMFRARGDENIYYIDGLKIFNQGSVECMPDLLHPDAEGIKIMGRNFIEEVKKLNILERITR